MTDNKTNIAVIGVGYWGKNLVRVFSKLGVLRAACDTDRKALASIKKDHPRLDIHEDISSVLNDPDITAVVIATPAATHYAVAGMCLSAGKDVFVEKPLALNIKEGRELLELANKKKRILMIGHLLEYHPAICRLKEMVASGELGKIQYVYSNRLNLGKFRKEENILWSFAPHDISAILAIIDEEPYSVSASGGNYLHRDVADVTVSILKFKSGVAGHIFVSWLHPYKEQKLVVIGDKKMAVFDDVAEKDKLLVFNHKINWVGRMPVSCKQDALVVDFVQREPLLAECEHFLDRLRDRTEPRTGAASALRVLKVLQACQASLENSGISLDLKDADDLSPDNYFVHPTSTVELPCRIGKGTKVWHYSHIMRGARIGRGCNIGQNVFIAAGTVIGNNVKIQNNVSVYEGVKLEDDVFCGPSVVFTNVLNPRAHVSRKDEYRPTIVGRGATLGANCTVVCGNKIGEYSFVGAGAVVTKDLPAHALAYGNPATVRGWVCKCGDKLKSPGKKTVCPRCGERFEFSKGKAASIIK